jgi:hypothetical protein
MILEMKAARLAGFTAAANRSLYWLQGSFMLLGGRGARGAQSLGLLSGGRSGVGCHTRRGTYSTANSGRKDDKPRSGQ